jgi:hypothetical protein
MAKLKSLTDLSEIYTSNVKEVQIKDSKVRDYNEILLTDTTNYLPESTMPKVGEGFGKQKDELVKGTGPQAADNFKKVTEEQDPGASKKTMKKDDTKDTEKSEEGEEHEGGETEKEINDDAKKHVKAEKARLTTSKEKLQEEVESALKNTKYKKQSFTMSKSKFDKLYEDALNGAPFAKDDEAAPVAPADDMGGEEPVTDTGADMGAEDSVTITLDRALAQKLHDALMGQLGGAEEPAPDMGDMGGDAGDEAPMAEEDDDDAMGEAVDAEDLGHPGPGSHAKSEQLKDGHKIHKVGALKAAGAASEQGGPKGGDGTVNKAKDFDKGLQKPTGNNQVGNLKVSKGTGNAFE